MRTIKLDNERMRTVNGYRLDAYDPNRVAGRYQLPVIKRCDYVPTDLIGFNYVTRKEAYEYGR